LDDRGGRGGEPLSQTTGWFIDEETKPVKSIRWERTNIGEQRKGTTETASREEEYSTTGKLKYKKKRYT